MPVIRTDATPAFVSLMRAAGHHARLLDARTDPLGGPYQGILANAVLHHLNRDQFEDVLRRARTSVAASGVLGLTVEEGDGAAWSEHKLGLPRHFTYWREPAVHAALHRAGWPDASICHVASRDNWLYVLARTSTAGPPGYKHPGQVPLTEPPAASPRTMTITKSGWSTRAGPEHNRGRHRSGERSQKKSRDLSQPSGQVSAVLAT